MKFEIEEEEHKQIDGLLTRDAALVKLELSEGRGPVTLEFQHKNSGVWDKKGFKSAKSAVKFLENNGWGT